MTEQRLLFCVGWITRCLEAQPDTHCYDLLAELQEEIRRQGRAIRERERRDFPDWFTGSPPEAKEKA